MIKNVFPKIQLVVFQKVGKRGDFDLGTTGAKSGLRTLDLWEKIVTVATR